MQEATSTDLLQYIKQGKKVILKYIGPTKKVIEVLWTFRTEAGEIWLIGY